ncbi:hypothetical protein ACFHW1_28475 [Micromonospora sp. LOL_014]|uniref:hypothetical protein n=2 Tax=unclassified Micromonospora TaxID=2617518 RepID=UPI003A865629
MYGELRLFADYHQIHLFDEGSVTDLGDVWTEGAVADQLAVGSDAMAVGTVANMSVSVKVEVLDDPPVNDWAEFDHVVEGSLHVPSGRLVVMGCTDYEPEAARFSVPEWARVRVAKSNLDAAISSDLEADPEEPATTEYMRIQVWEAALSSALVLKRWRSKGVE